MVNEKFFTIVVTLFFAFFFGFFDGKAQQQTDDRSPIAAIVYLDSFVVSAKRQGFDAADFIDMVRKDKSFYKAFKNLRTVDFEATTQMSFWGRKEKLLGSYESVAQQKITAGCRITKQLKEAGTGNFFKRNKKLRYYTAKMFDNIFFSKDTICEGTHSIDEGQRLDFDDEHSKGIQNHIQELKKLIFQPGEKVDVPMIGSKTALFDEEIQPYYNYSIRSQRYKNGIDCYVFKAEVKPEFHQKKEGKTIIKYLETFFEKTSFQVVARNYHLAYSGVLFSFDVAMFVELTTINGVYLPESIQYNGEWNIPAKAKEKGIVKARFYNFR